MPKNTDKFLKVAPNVGWQLDANGIPDSSVDNFGLVNVSGIPTDTAVLITTDRVDSSGNKTPEKMERILGIISEGRMTSCIRGVEGTAQYHAAGAVVEIVISATNFNKWVEALLVEHKQSGIHRGPVFAEYEPEADATVTLDLDAANVHKILLPAGAITVEVINGSVGQLFVLELTQSESGGGSVNFFETIRWEDDTVPSLSGAGKRDKFGFEIQAAGTYDGHVISDNQ